MVLGCFCIGHVHAQDSQFVFDPNGNLTAQATEITAPPQILSQPQDQVVQPGALASFSVVVADTRGLTYQWRSNSTTISGATSDALLLQNVSAADAGQYSVVLVNSSGSVTSAPAALMLDGDRDGLPDSWEQTYFGGLSQNPTGDFDGDGVSNRDELLQGTNPADNTSVLFRLTVINDGGHVTVNPGRFTFTNGEVVTLTATAVAPNTFHGWRGATNTTTENVISLVMDGHKTVYAYLGIYDITWTNNASGDWNVASNWSPDFVPSTNDNVFLTKEVSVTLNSNTACGSLTLTAGTLSGSGTLTVNRDCWWPSGAMSGSGRTVIGPGATLTLNPASGVTLTTRVLENAGTVQWTGAGSVFLNNAVITNRAGALFQAGNASSLIAFGGVSRFDNAGTFRKTAGGTTWVNSDLTFNNYNVVEVQAGTLFLQGGGLNQGTMDFPAGTTLNLSGGTFTQSAGGSITGAGNFIVSGGAANLAGLVNLRGPHTFSNGEVNLTGNYFCTNNVLTISGGTANFNGTGLVQPTTVTLSGGILSGNQLVTVLGGMTWSDASMSGSGRTVIPPGVTLTLNPVSAATMTTRVLENGGTVQWTGAGSVFLSNAVITNRAGALFQAGNASSLIAFGGVSRFDNAGTFRKTAGGTTWVNSDLTFNNYNVVEVQAGTLFLQGGGLNQGTMDFPAGTTLNLSGGTFTQSAGGSITGAGNFIVSGGAANLAGLVNLRGPHTFSNGEVNLTGNYFCTNNVLTISGGTANFNGTGLVQPTTVTLSGGILSGNQLVTVLGGMTWSDASMSGSGRTVIPPGVTLTLNPVSAATMTTRVLENGGTVQWTGAGSVFLSNAVITNRAGALFQAQNASSLIAFGGVSRFDNAGTFRKTAGGTTWVNSDLTFNNYNVVEVQAGTLFLQGGGLNQGTMDFPAGTTLNLSGGTFTQSAGGSITGAGNFIVSGGAANLAGLVNLRGPHTFSNGEVNLTGNYFCTNNVLTISGGTANFNGTGLVQPTTVTLSGGILSGNQLVTVLGGMTWSDASMSGSGRTVIPPGVTLTLNPVSAATMTTRVLENGGTVQWTGAGSVFLSNAVITNRAGALFQAQNASSLIAFGGVSRFDNAGTFRKTAGGTTTVNSPMTFNNYNTVDIRTGILAASGGYTSTTNSLLNCALGGTAVGTGYGRLQVSSAVTLNGALSVDLINGFVPATNDTFTVLTADSRNGTFANFLYPSNAVTMQLSNTANSVIVRVTDVFSVAQPAPVPAGLISWWRAEGNALDNVGTNHGVLTNGATFAPGQAGQTFALDGVNDFVQVPDSASLRPVSVTIEAWVKFFATNGIRIILVKPLGTGTLDSYGLALQDGAVLAAVADNSGFGPFLIGPANTVPGQWYHLAYTFDDSSKQQVLYVNGIPVASGTANKTMSYDAQPVLLGADIEDGVLGFFHHGQIDEASLYNRALAGNEIATIYNAGVAGKSVLALTPPTLHIESIAPTAARLYWSTNSPTYHLESNPSLNTTNWAASALTPVVTGTNFVVTNSLFGAQKFYRLSRVPALYTPPPPSLTIQRASAGAVRLLWPAEDDRTFTLQSCTNLSLTNWLTASPPPAILGWNNVVTNPISGTQKFYRLISP